MPSGVEHHNLSALDLAAEDPITVSMPSGVEHVHNGLVDAGGVPDHRLDAFGR